MMRQYVLPRMGGQGFGKVRIWFLKIVLARHLTSQKFFSFENTIKFFLFKNTRSRKTRKTITTLLPLKNISNPPPHIKTTAYYI
jgi:hypothetical protein